LLGESSCLADWALLPFVRQFRIADPAVFDAALGIGALQAWLARFEAGTELAAVMAPPLAPRHPWRSPSWLYHLALAEEWQQAQAEGVYRRSTRGLSIEQVGFLHASHGDQIAATFERFYTDAGPVRLLTIDAQHLAAAGLEVRLEPSPESGELFPHLYGGPLPCGAVVAAESYRP
jgi:glutathione S-transferase